MTRSTMTFSFLLAMTFWALVRVRSVKMVKRIVQNFTKATVVGVASSGKSRFKEVFDYRRLGTFPKPSAAVDYIAEHFTAELRRIALLALLSTPLACAARAESPAPETNATLSATAAQSDFDLMQHALEGAHPGVYRYSTKAEKEAVFAAERKK